MQIKITLGLVLLLAAGTLTGCIKQTVAEPTAEEICRRAFEEIKDRDFDRAEKSLAEALALRPKYAGAYYGLGVIHEAREYWDDALEAYDRAIDLDPEFAHAFYARGTLLNELSENDDDEAEGDEDLQAAYELDETLRPVEGGRLIVNHQRSFPRPWRH